MIQSATTLLLALLCLLLVWANIETFRASPDRQANEMASPPLLTTQPGSKPTVLALNPQPATPLPDLYSGYLFNAERFLRRPEKSAKTGLAISEGVRLDDAIFTGSFIDASYKKALVSYRPAQQQPQAQRPGQHSPAPSRLTTVQLQEGDELGGYTVEAINPDFIIFTKGNDTVKKMLFDPGKERQQMAPRPPVTPSSPATRPVAAPPVGQPAAIPPSRP